jgi:GWxTD domain-containing protein
MQPFSTSSGAEGHPPGGPRCFPLQRSTLNRVQNIISALAATAVAACGARGTGPEGERPRADEPLSHPLEIYRDVGFLTGPAQFPAVARFTTVAGPADSSYVLLGLSLPNNSLRFQRDGDGFFAEYRVDLTFMDEDSAAVKRIDAREVVRVTTFAETGRTDESIVYQQGIALLPGRYVVRVQAADVNSSRGFRMSDTLTVPDYSLTTVSAPVLVYEAQGRTSRTTLPQLIINPRSTVAFGSSAPRVYLESYGDRARPIDVRVVGDDGGILWSASVLPSDGGPDIHYAVIEIPSETIPLGKFWVDVASDGAHVARAPLIMTISDQWMVVNIHDVVQFLRYIANPHELDSLTIGTPAQQRMAWEHFWQRRDPLPITAVNEYHDAFFRRVRYATEAFREPGGIAGWKTDRGEVYIVLGPPDNTVERYAGNADPTGQPNAEEWLYTALPGGRLVLLFHDRSGFGRYELVPSSASAFRNAADRLRARASRN